MDERKGAVLVLATVEQRGTASSSRALLRPKQGRSSNLLWVGSSNRSRVSLIRLPSLIIPREFVGAVSLAPALQASLPAPLCASVHSTACPVPGSLSQSPSCCHSRLLHLQQPEGGEVLWWPGLGKGFKHCQKGDKRLLHCKVTTFN